MKIESGIEKIINTSHGLAMRKQQMSKGDSPSFAANLSEHSRTQEGESKENVGSGSHEKLDFTNMTAAKLHKVVGQLIRRGQMDLDDTTSLVGMMFPSSPLAKVKYDGLPAEYIDTPVNFFEKIKEKIDGALSRNKQDTAASLKRAADALSNFQGYENLKIDKKI